jgi:hypothetical protein
MALRSSVALVPTAPACSYNNITSPFGKPWDLSQKADQECWLIAFTAASNHVCFNVSMATAKHSWNFSGTKATIIAGVF